MNSTNHSSTRFQSYQNSTFQRLGKEGRFPNRNRRGKKNDRPIPRMNIKNKTKHNSSTPTAKAPSETYFTSMCTFFNRLHILDLLDSFMLQNPGQKYSVGEGSWPHDCLGRAPMLLLKCTPPCALTQEPLSSICGSHWSLRDIS